MWLVVYGLYYALAHSFYTHFAESFYHKGMLNSVIASRAHSQLARQGLRCLGWAGPSAGCTHWS